MKTNEVEILVFDGKIKTKRGSEVLVSAANKHHPGQGRCNCRIKISKSAGDAEIEEGASYIENFFGGNITTEAAKRLIREKLK